MKCVACDTRLTGRATRFCSNRCKVATWKRERPDAAQQQRERASRALADKARQRDLPLRQCLLCGETFGSARGAMLCSDDCRKALDRRKQRARDEAKPVAERACMHCGSVFRPVYGSKRRVFCSGICASAAARKHGRGGNAQRAKRFGGERRYFNERRIFVRDGWICQLCGVRTPERLRGKHLPTSPELDHIVPLSQGGGHVQENCQCVCRACNGSKGARPLGQLWLGGIADVEPARRKARSAAARLG